MKKIITITILFLLLAPAVAWAQFDASVNALNDIAGGAGLEQNLQTPISTTIATALSLLGIIFLALTVYAGFLWMTAAGNEDKVSKAQKILVAAVIGMIVITSAYTITYFVTKSLGAGSSGSKVNQTKDCNDLKGKCISEEENCSGTILTGAMAGCRCCLNDNTKLPSPDKSWSK